MNFSLLYTAVALLTYSSHLTNAAIVQVQNKSGMQASLTRNLTLLPES
jgi:hypothetical protein